MISVVILTKNEEADLPSCLATLGWCDDVHVVDSGSKDGTEQIAAKAGAHWYVNAFKGFGQQRNWSLEHCALKYDWVLFLDADEWVTDKFLEECRALVSSAASGVVGAYCCPKLMYRGVWLKRCDNFPKWQFRLVHRSRGRFVDSGHGQKEAEIKEGESIAYIREPYLHFAFSKGMTAWIDRHNNYSTKEAVARLQGKVVFRELFSPHSSLRNKSLKVLLLNVPGWPLGRFLWTYLLRLGFLEGRAGFIFCVNMAYYEFTIKVKSEEMKIEALGKSR